MTNINIKRVYADAEGENGDGFRIFIDRLWPRGESKEKFHYDLWAKNVAPSDELRCWFHENPDERWDEFEKRYLEELNRSPDAISLVGEVKSHDTVTLLFSSRDEEHNNAFVLKQFLQSKLG
ncbi:MAG: DUF488 family protein [Muribaculaceae bacterium]|nr:DUF488 family protein [Muribaculaceae bacterium]